MRHNERTNLAVGIVIYGEAKRIMVARDRIELPTRGFSVPCSTNGATWPLAEARIKQGVLFAVKPKAQICLYLIDFFLNYRSLPTLLSRCAFASELGETQGLTGRRNEFCGCIGTFTEEELVHLLFEELARLGLDRRQPVFVN